MNSISNTERPPTVSGAEYSLWLLGVVVCGLFIVPGLGALLGLTLGLTRLRRTTPMRRWAPLALGVGILGVQLIGLSGGVETHHVFPGSQVP